MRPDTAASLLEAMPLPAILIHQEGRITAANSAAQAVLGVQAVGWHYVTALRQPALLDPIEATLGDSQPRETTFLNHNSRADVSYRVTVRPTMPEVRQAQDRDTGHGVLVCFEDITDLEHAGQMRRDFVANVSHELRTPLTALIGFIETLRGPARDDAKARDRFLRTMHSEAG
ncbi:MAG: histidine kinase dimerization/phospho-acceptor domain-containing protein, partial [Primorskyibacter sp.]